MIYNEKGATYLQDLQTDLEALVRAYGARRRGPPAGVFVVRAERVVGAERALLLACCRVVLDASQGSLAEQVQRFQPVRRDPPPSRPEVALEPGAPVERSAARASATASAALPTTAAST